MSKAYEIELVVSHGADYTESLLATLTGLPKHEIWERLPEHLKERGSWRGSSFVEVARLLGYNCNKQFIRFDACTPWPCILRCQVPWLKSKWWALVYANGAVYDPWQQSVTWLDDFVRFNPEASITSMLQIWIP
jgi:hypothetical protein